MMPTHAMERVQCNALSVYIASSKKSSPKQLSILFDPAVGKLSPRWLAKLPKKKQELPVLPSDSKPWWERSRSSCCVLGTTLCQWAAWKGHAEEMNSSVFNTGHRGFCLFVCLFNIISTGLVKCILLFATQSLQGAKLQDSFLL